MDSWTKEPEPECTAGIKVLGLVPGDNSDFQRRKNNSNLQIFSVSQFFLVILNIKVFQNGNRSVVTHSGTGRVDQVIAFMSP